MKVAMLRVGIDTGSGGIHGPLFQDGSFEYIPIPDGRRDDERTYGNTVGRRGAPLVEYFPARRRSAMANQPIHFDPEFATFTYGDPTPPKAGLRRLEAFVHDVLRHLEHIPHSLKWAFINLLVPGRPRMRMISRMRNRAST